MHGVLLNLLIRDVVRETWHHKRHVVALTQWVSLITRRHCYFVPRRHTSLRIVKKDRLTVLLNLAAVSISTGWGYASRLLVTITGVIRFYRVVELVTYSRLARDCFKQFAVHCFGLELIVVGISSNTAHKRMRFVESLLLRYEIGLWAYRIINQVTNEFISSSQAS